MQDGGSVGGPEAGTVLGPCGPGNACPSGSVCLFAIGSCAAGGECVSNGPPGGVQCSSRTLLCGCDGTTVMTGCGTFGLATGATTGAPSTVAYRSGDPDFCPEAGTGSKDAAVVFVDAGGSADAPVSSCNTACEAQCGSDAACIAACGC